MNQKRAIFRLVGVLLLLVGQPSIAVQTPPEAAPFFQRVGVEINGNRLLLNGSQPIEVVSGDLLIINDAWVQKSTSLPQGMTRSLLLPLNWNPSKYLPITSKN